MRSSLVAFIPIVLCVSLSATAQSQGLELIFDSQQHTLTLRGDLPRIEPGKPFTLHVSNVTAQPAWVPQLGGQPFTFGTVDESGVTFAITVDGKVTPDASGRFPFTVTDVSDTPVRLVDSPLLLLRVGDAGGQESSTGDCLLAQPNDLLRPRRGENHIYLMFNEEGLPLRPIPADLDENDDISILMLLPCADVSKYTVQIEGTLANGEMNILSSGALEGLSKIRTGLTSAAGRDTFYMGTFGPFAPPQVTVIIKRQEGAQVREVRRQVMRVLKNYIGSFRLGVGRSNVRFNDFVLSAPAAGGAANVITNKSDENGDPRYFVSMVFYAWHVWDNRFWNGRDISETPNALDRLNPYVAVGLKDPGREFIAGFNYEIARGLDVVWGVHIARTEQLTNGATEGATFTGSADDLPRRNRWSTATNFWGVSIDLDAGVKVLRGILGT
jgi:hypothetical protein